MPSMPLEYCLPAIYALHICPLCISWLTALVARCTLHLSDGQSIGTNAYHMDLASVLSALLQSKLAFTHQDLQYIIIWTDCEAVYKGLSFDDWECPTDSASITFLQIFYNPNVHRLSIHWQTSHQKQTRKLPMNSTSWTRVTISSIISRNKALPERPS
jgi:hypothetical protein